MNPEPMPAQRPSFIPRLLLGLVDRVCDHPQFVLAVSLVLCAVSLFASSRYLQYKTQRNDLLSPHKDCQQRWRQYLAEFGDDDDVVAVVRGADRARMEQALDALARRVRAKPEEFDRLFYKVDLRPLRNRALLFLSTEQIQRIQDSVRRMEPLLKVPLAWELFTLRSLMGEATERLSHFRPGDPLSPGDEEFLIQLAAISRSAAALLRDPTDYHNPWASLAPQGSPEQSDQLDKPQYFFSGAGPDGRSLAFLLARPIKETGSFTAAQRSVTALRQMVAETNADFPDLEMGLTGLPVLENDEMTAAEHDTRLASWLAVAGVTVLFFLVYRGIWYPLLTVATLLIGTAWAMGWLTLTVGHLNILSAAFAVMLIGMGDYGVLWVMRYEQARRSGADVRSALLHTTTHVAVGNLTAASTLALAFFAAILADFQAVAELGWIAGCGVLLCALACFTVLPALLMLFDRRFPGRKDEGGRMKKGLIHPSSFILHPFRRDGWLPRLTARPGWIVAVGIAITAALGVAASQRLGYDHNLLHLQAANLDAVKWELTLIDHTAGASWHSLTIADSPEQARALKARFEARTDLVSRVVEVASLVPADQERKLEQLRDIQERLRKLPARGRVIPHLPPMVEDLRAEVGQLLEKVYRRVAIVDVPRDGGETAEAEGEEPPLERRLRDALAALYEALGGPDRAPLQGRLQDFERRLTMDLAEELHRLRDVSTPEAITLADVPDALRERYVSPNGKWLLRVFARQSLWDFGPLEEFCRQMQAIDPHATGKPFTTVEGLRAMKNGLTRAGIYAFLVIAAVLLLDFRTVGKTLVALAPLVMGVALALGVMTLAGVPLNPANMIAFPLILGVGVDNGVHVLHDWLLRRAEGHRTISHPIGRGVLVKALTTMIGFGTLMVSTERGLVGLGFILTLGVGCCMLTALVFLPAVLRLFDTDRVSEAEETSVPEESRLAA
jgi:hopanoid biosynthesis associated RND transporter like protein HpnN